jgi:hypothetical protein
VDRKQRASAAQDRYMKAVDERNPKVQIDQAARAANSYRRSSKSPIGPSWAQHLVSTLRRVEQSVRELELQFGQLAVRLRTLDLENYVCRARSHTTMDGDQRAYDALADLEAGQVEDSEYFGHQLLHDSDGIGWHDDE